MKATYVPQNQNYGITLYFHEKKAWGRTEPRPTTKTKQGQDEAFVKDWRLQRSATTPFLLRPLSLTKGQKQQPYHIHARQNIFKSSGKKFHNFIFESHDCWRVRTKGLDPQQGLSCSSLCSWQKARISTLTTTMPEKPFQIKWKQVAVVQRAVLDLQLWYSCNNITKTLIQISHLFYIAFFPKTNHQMII